MGGAFRCVLMLVFISLLISQALCQGNGRNNNRNNRPSGTRPGQRSPGKGKGPSRDHGPPLSLTEEDTPPEFISIEETKGRPTVPHHQHLPAQVELRFEMIAQSLSLNLTWNKHVKDTVPIIVGNGQPGKGGMRKWKPKKKQKFAMYTDVNNRASVFIKSNKLSDNILDYAGSFYMGKDEYVLEPMDWDNPWGGDLTLGNMHMVYKKKHSPPEGEYDNEQKGSDPVDLVDDRDWAVRGESVPISLNDKRQYGVESLLIIDYALYKKWYEASSKSSAGEKMEDAIENIRYYFTHVMNGVDMRYRSIDQPDFRMYVALSGLYIATTPDAASFTQQHLTPGSPHNDLASYEVIDTLITWLEDHRSELPPHDQATMFTSDYLISGYSGNRILGLAKIAGTCRGKSVALNRDEGGYSATQTGAHEMGHNLGAQHDGLDNHCNTYDQYIMATNPITLTDNIYRNAFTFSPCSIQDFREYMEQLNSYNTNCLLDVAEDDSNIDIDGILSTLPGERYTPHEQCQIIFGAESFFCGGKTEEMGICRQMECFHPQLRYCYSTAEMRAATGTTCGNNHWCQEGDCVYSADAPSAPDECIHGDYIGPYRNGLSCQLIREEQNWHCYDEYYLDDCCASCAQIYDTSKPDCVYGDKDDCRNINPERDCSDRNTREKCCKTCADVISDECYDMESWCGSQIQGPRDCYDFADTCCASCERYSTNIQGCEYGDRARWCDTQTARHCYNVEDTCCEKCHGLLVDTEDDNCRYGVDREEYCSSITPSSCYDQENTCCSTCKLYETNIPGCEYGDKTHGCTLSSCSDQAGRELCCGTCQQSIPVTTPRPTDPNCVDKATWCVDMDAYYCYDIKDTCCETCSQFNTGVAACEFGDMYSWCAPLYCQSASLSKDCCVTCGMITTPTALPVTSTEHAETRPTYTYTPRPTTFKPQSGCTTADEKFCLGMPVRDCYVYDTQCCNYCYDYLMSTEDGNCMYGDHVSWCSSYIQSADYCKNEVLYECCDSCERWLTGSVATLFPTAPSTATTTTTIAPSGKQWPGCGPQQVQTPSWCASFGGSICYTDLNTCCEDCEQFWTGTEECEFGDKASWCADYIESHPSNCYYEELTCCGVCERYRTYIKGCEYGDKSQNCVQQDCTDPVRSEECCLTCGLGADVPPTAQPTTASTTTSGPIVPDVFCEHDSASWCNTISHRNASFCYKDHDSCCMTCEEFYTGLPGCEYGDHFSWCYVLDKKLCPYYQEDCCVSCG